MLEWNRQQIQSFKDKFGEDTFNSFEKAQDRLKRAGYSTDITQWIKKYETKEEVISILSSLYNDKKDAGKKRIISGNTRNVRGKYNFLGEFNGYLVYQPLDYISSMDLGINTGWCTTGRYEHAGHPEFTPSSRDAKRHFNEYNNNGIELYYFLDKNTFYGEYAIALYQETFNVNKFIDDYYVKDTNFEMFNSKDEHTFNQDIMDIAVNKLGFDLEYSGTESDENGLVIIDNIVCQCDFKKVPKDLVIPDSVKGIGERAFYWCAELTSIVIPNSVTSIGREAFHNCTSLISVTIHNSETNIEGWAFSYCTSLTSITIPDRVSSIGDSVFFNCASLKTITIPNSVTDIGGGSFSGCTGLTSITIPDSVTSIGAGAFSGCIGLTSVIIPSHVMSIEQQVFDGCTSLKKITIPNGVISIGEAAFYRCANLISVTIPSSVNSILPYAFFHCTDLTSIIYEGTKSDWTHFKNEIFSPDMKEPTIHCTDGDISI